MATCYTLQPDPNGSGYLLLDPNGQAPEVCTGVVMLNVSDYMQINYGIANILNNPFVMTEVQGAQIGGAILLVWSVAWVFRALARLVVQSTKEDES